MAIDGVDGVGKTCFADELAELVSFRQVIRASVDGFHHPRRLRYRQGKDSPEGYFADSYNYGALKRLLLDPLKWRTAGTFQTRCFDHRVDAETAETPQAVPSTFVLIFDGIFLHRPELIDYWDYSVLLDATRKTSIERCIEREGAAGVSSDPNNPIHKRYVRGQEIYFESCDPKSKATRVVNNETILAPYIVA